ncbi:MAG: DUF5777 family beta-barrel protein [Flavobacteriia bacterium]|jgi:hypothetical protein
MKKKLFFVSILVVFCFPIVAQVAESNDSLYTEEEYVEEESNLVEETFMSSRVINGHSVEMLRKGVLEFRVEHRFGDIAGTNGGVQTLFGLDNSSDIRIAFEYGVTDKFMAGIGRSKGTGNPYTSLIDGFVKYRILQQEKKGMPISMALIGTSSMSYAKASSDESMVQYYPKFSHRFAYCAQLNIARKFGERLSLAVMPTVVHRNYVLQSDVNTLFALGGALRCGLTSRTAILLEYYHCFNPSGTRAVNVNSLGIAFEWITFGHNFTINLTNSRGFGETQFIPYTYEDWLKGQFRLGFCIGRKYQGE